MLPGGIVDGQLSTGRQGGAAARDRASRTAEPKTIDTEKLDELGNEIAPHRRPHRRRLFRMKASALRHPARAPLRLRRHRPRRPPPHPRPADHHPRRAARHRHLAVLRSAPRPAGDVHRFLRQRRHHPRLSRAATIISTSGSGPRRGRGSRAAARPVAGARRACSARSAAIWSLGANSPHHFLGRLAAGRRSIPRSPPMPDRASSERHRSRPRRMDYCLSIHRDFAYDHEATEVDTAPAEAFRLQARRLPGLRPRDDRRPSRRRHPGRLCLGLPPHHPAQGQAAARGRRRHACLGPRLVRPGMPAGSSSTPPTR